MLTTCGRFTSGGKGNQGMFIERDKKICAAGLPSAQPNENAKSNLEHYLMQEEVDAIIGDTIRPLPKVTRLPPLRHPIPRDMRNAGSFSEGSLLINPLKKTKFQSLVEDLKTTCYYSYWKNQVGKGPDPTPNLPIGYEVYGTKAGKKTEFHGRLYDIVMPKDPIPVDVPVSQRFACQTDRNYNKPPFDPNKVFGIKVTSDKSGRQVKCCLSDDRVHFGTAWAKPMVTSQVNFMNKQAKLATVTAPNDNINCVPQGFIFGIPKEMDPNDNVSHCLTMCDINPDRMFLKKCLAHLNTLRKCLSKRFDCRFFSNLYLNLKYYDKEGTGWLPKQIVYDYCATKHIRFDSTLIEPLSSIWNAFDGSKVEYRNFISLLNFTLNTPDLPKVHDISDECLHFRTTYKEMVKPGQEIDKKSRAGLPSGRYFDADYPVTPEGCCKADRSYLSHESDARACLNPSVFTNLGVSHRDMYAKREPHVVKRVFEAAGDRFTTVEFDLIWETAKKYHPKGYVSYETFYRALIELNLENVK